MPSQFSEPKNRNSLPAFSLSPAIAHALPRTGLSLWAAMRCLSVDLLSRARTAWRICSASFRSFRGHIRTQFSKHTPILSLGSALVLEVSTGRYLPKERTLARSFYREGLSAIYPWIDTTDLRIFLIGFDAGEQWTLSRKSDIESQIPPDLSWLLHLLEEKVGYVPDKVRQEMSAFRSRISEADSRGQSPKSPQR